MYVCRGVLKATQYLPLLPIPNRQTQRQMKHQKKEIPIGGVGVIDGYKVMAHEYMPSNSCDDCCFSFNSGYKFPCPKMSCHAHSRIDHKHVYFTIVEQ